MSTTPEGHQSTQTDDSVSSAHESWVYVRTPSSSEMSSPSVGVISADSRRTSPVSQTSSTLSRLSSPEPCLFLKLPQEIRDMIFRHSFNAQDKVVDTRKIKLLGVSKEIRAEVKYVLIKEFIVNLTLERLLTCATRRDRWLYQAQRLRIVAFNGAMMEHGLPTLYNRTDLKELHLMLRSRPNRFEQLPENKKMQELAKQFENFERKSLPSGTVVGWAARTVFSKAKECSISLKELDNHRPKIKFRLRR